jgi:serine/threonine protein phosphatase PrpC
MYKVNKLIVLNFIIYIIAISLIEASNQTIQLSPQDRMLEKPLYSTVTLKDDYDLQRIVSIVKVSQQNNRRYQEDRAIVIADDRFVGIGLFDGHGGAEVSEKLSDRKGLIFESLDCFSKNHHAKRNYYGCDLKKLFVDFNENHFKNSKAGSTAVCAFFIPEKIIIANVGDSRAIDSNGQAITRDHKPFFKEEEDRINKAGSFVLWPRSLAGTPRLGGIFLLSRAFGDTAGFNEEELKGMIAEPDIFERSYEINDIFPERIKTGREEIVNSFIILASDGLWDFLPTSIKKGIFLCLSNEASNSQLSEKEKESQNTAVCINKVAAHIVNKILNAKGFNKDGFEHAALALMLATIQKEEFDTNKCITLSKGSLQKLVHEGKNEIQDNQIIVIIGWEDVKQNSILKQKNHQPKNLIQPEPIQRRRQPRRRYLRRRFRGREQNQ